MSDIVIPLSSPLIPSIDQDVSLSVYLQYAKQPLYTGSIETRDKLLSSIDSSVTHVPFQFGSSALQDNIRISIDLEDMYVWQAGTANSPLVERGDNGTAPASHLAGSMIYISPKFSPAEILREINNELRQLSAPGSGLYRVNVITLTSITARRGYDLDPAIAPEDILEVTARVPGESRDWQQVNIWRIERNANSTDFPSGYGFFIYESLPSNVEIRITYRARFSFLSTLSDQVLAVSGLPESALDIPLLGAVIRLTAGRELKRNYEESQGDTRRASEVGSGANLNATSALRELYFRRVKEEANRLYRAYPARKARNWNLV